MATHSGTPPAVVIDGLRKQYGSVTAVKNLTLEVAAGELFGFLGLNGAGKTTTIRILLDLLRPTGGRAQIFGQDCQAQGLRARAQIGYLPSELGFYPNMTGRAVLDFLAGLNRQKADLRFRGELQERLQLPDRDLRRKVREFSTGMKRKLGLIQAFQADPPLLILDEPTEGLDPLMKEAFYDLLVDVQRRGRTIFMSSHVLSEVERVCGRVALLRQGELALLETVNEIRQLATRKVRVIFAADVSAPAFPDAVQVVELQPREWRLRVAGPLAPLLRLLADLPLLDLEVSEPRLEDVLIPFYREGHS